MLREWSKIAAVQNIMREKIKQTIVGARKISMLIVISLFIFCIFISLLILLINSGIIALFYLENSGNYISCARKFENTGVTIFCLDSSSQNLEQKKVKHEISPKHC